MDLWRTAAYEVGAEKGQAVARSGMDQLSAVDPRLAPLNPRARRANAQHLPAVSARGQMR